MTTTFAPPNPATVVDLPAPGAWVLEWRGNRYSEADLKGMHLSTLALITGSDDWESLDIDPRHGHQRLMMMIAACEAVRSADEANGDETEAAVRIGVAVKTVREASVDEILGAFRRL